MRDQYVIFTQQTSSDMRVDSVTRCPAPTALLDPVRQSTMDISTVKV